MAAVLLVFMLALPMDVFSTTDSISGFSSLASDKTIHRREGFRVFLSGSSPLHDPWRRQMNRPLSPASSGVKAWTFSSGRWGVEGWTFRLAATS